MLHLRARLYSTRLFGQTIRIVPFLRDARLAVRTLFGGSVGDRFILDALCNRPELAMAVPGLADQIPQAQLFDHSLTQYEHRDWRKHFSRRLQGQGLEIGALHRPMPTHDGMRMHYVDRHPLEQLKQEMPELAPYMVPVDVVDDAETLGRVGEAQYDFLVAAHVIEHMRNPIGTIVHWMRVLKPGGTLYLVVPDKRRTFDRARVRTMFEHLVLDYRQPSRERDFEHFLDFAHHVHQKPGDEAIAYARQLEQEDYSIHFHTFLPKDLVRLIGWIDQHVQPMTVIEGPAMSPDADEFHLLVRKGRA